MFFLSRECGIELCRSESDLLQVQLILILRSQLDSNRIRSISDLHRSSECILLSIRLIVRREEDQIRIASSENPLAVLANIQSDNRITKPKVERVLRILGDFIVQADSSIGTSNCELAVDRRRNTREFVIHGILFLVRCHARDRVTLRFTRIHSEDVLAINRVECLRMIECAELRFIAEITDAIRQVFICTEFLHDLTLLDIEVEDFIVLLVV